MALFTLSHYSSITNHQITYSYLHCLLSLGSSGFRIVIQLIYLSTCAPGCIQSTSSFFISNFWVAAAEPGFAFLFLCVVPSYVSENAIVCSAARFIQMSLLKPELCVWNYERPRNGQLTSAVKDTMALANGSKDVKQTTKSSSSRYVCYTPLQRSPEYRQIMWAWIIKQPTVPDSPLKTRADTTSTAHRS